MRVIQFDFEDGDVITVVYNADRNMDNEIEDAVSSYLESNEDNFEYEDLVNDVMNSFDEIKDWLKLEEADFRCIKI